MSIPVSALNFFFFLLRINDNIFKFKIIDAAHRILQDSISPKQPVYIDNLLNLVFVRSELYFLGFKFTNIDCMKQDIAAHWSLCIIAFYMLLHFICYCILYHTLCIIITIIYYC